MQGAFKDGLPKTLLRGQPRTVHLLFSFRQRKLRVLSVRWRTEMFAQAGYIGVAKTGDMKVFQVICGIRHRL